MDAWPRAAQGAPFDPDSSGLTRTRRLELGSLIDVAFKRTPGLGRFPKGGFFRVPDQHTYPGSRWSLAYWLRPLSDEGPNAIPIINPLFSQ